MEIYTTHTVGYTQDALFIMCSGKLYTILSFTGTKRSSNTGDENIYPNTFRGGGENEVIP